MQAVVNNLLTSYSQTGKGRKSILMIHGWADDGQSFKSLTKQLAENKKYKILTLDLPGFGGTENPPTAWGLGDYASFIYDFLNKIDEHPYSIIGHSNGGAIAINGLAGGKLKAEKLILIASAGIRKPSLKKTALRIASKPAGLAIRILPPPVQKRLRKKLYSAIGSDYLVAEHMQDTFKRVVSDDVADAAATLRIPACLIYGENDTSTPPELGRLLAEALPDSSLDIIPEAGHFVHQEQVYKVSEIIKEFIK